MSSIGLPEKFLDRLRRILPANVFDAALASFTTKDVLAVRVNFLKTTVQEVSSMLASQGIGLTPVSWSPDAFIATNCSKEDLSFHALVSDGSLYFQNLSSLVPAIILDPKPGEKVLDLCAAPGSKTTQMASMMKNQGQITAIEVARSRFFKLRAVCDLLGTLNVKSFLTDARRFRSSELFDKVLVDAPCSSEGRFKMNEPKTFGYWSPRKIKEMAEKQKGLLMSAGRLVKPGGHLVYSTCTFSPEENESVVDWFMRKTDGAFVFQKIELKGIPSYPCLQGWEKRSYTADVSNCLRILPDGQMSGFFVAHFVRSL